MIAYRLGALDCHSMNYAVSLWVRTIHCWHEKIQRGSTGTSGSRMTWLSLLMDAGRMPTPGRNRPVPFFTVTPRCTIALCNALLQSKRVQHPRTVRERRDGKRDDKRLQFDWVSCSASAIMANSFKAIIRTNRREECFFCIPLSTPVILYCVCAHRTLRVIQPTSTYFIIWRFLVRFYPL